MTARPSPAADRIRVVVADDSPFVCRLLTSYLQSSPDLQVVGTALNGARAVDLVRQLRPDALTLDVEMPQMDGLAALEQIMLECPTPVIMVSGVSRAAARVTLDALELGAVDFVLKYTPGADTNPEALRRELVAKVRAASQIKVIRALGVTNRRSANGDPAGCAPGRHANRPTVTAWTPEIPPDALPGGVVVIGASTGGPLALRELLGNLPPEFPAAILVVQHMPANFTGVLATQLNRRVALQVKEAEPGDRLRPGLVLVAPGGHHLLLRPDARVELNQGPTISGHRPSIDVTMQSVAQVYGSRTRGVVLTGMGSDGSLGLLAIRAKGGRTYAQDAASCVVNGMPQRAIEQGSVIHTGTPAAIARLLWADHAHRPEGARVAGSEIGQPC